MSYVDLEACVRWVRKLPNVLCLLGEGANSLRMGPFAAEIGVMVQFWHDIAASNVTTTSSDNTTSLYTTAE